MTQSASPHANIALYYSNEAESLLIELAHNLQNLRSSLANPLAPIIVAVPNTNVAQWLSYGISQHLGISANIDFIFLEKIFRRVVAQTLPEATVLNKTTVEAALVLYLSSKPWLSNTALAPLGAYIEHGAGLQENPIVHSARLFSMASELAQAFDDYSLSRHEMVEAWNKQELVISPTHRMNAMESWQSALWRAMFGKGGFFETQTEHTQKRYGFLGNLFMEAIQKAERTGINIPAALEIAGSELHFFGFSYVATGYIKMFGALSKHFSVRFYALNPCSEFWEDSKTLFEEHRDAARNKNKREGQGNHSISEHQWEGDTDDLLGLESRFFRNTNEHENLALRLWGKPGREYTRALQSLTQCEFIDCFRDPTRHHGSLLNHLQRCILLRMPRPEFATAPFHKDESITYLASQGGPKRELEAIAAEIWKLVEASENTSTPLRFNEIAIILPASEKETYESLIHTVFHESSKLPLRVIDSTARATNSLVDAFARFLELPFASNTRGPLLRFLTTPAILERHGGSAEARKSATALAHIFVGSDAADLSNTYITSDAFNWDQGLLRLTLGSLMKGTTEREPSVFTNESTHESYAVEDTQNHDEVRSFVVLARSVLADLHFLRTENLPLVTWLHFFHAALTAYLPYSTSEPEQDTLMRTQCHAIISELQELAPASAAPINGFTAARFLLSRIQKLTTGENGLGLDGVMVASFLPMRPIPLRVLFIVGMGEGHFPSTDKHGPLDLRAAKRRVADVTPREQDKYMFLETLLSVREKLCISWIARGQSDNEPLEPSGLVHELNQALVEMGASPIDVKIALTIPLRRYTSLTDYVANPEVLRERACKLAHESIKKDLPSGEYPEKHEILARIQHPAAQTLGIAKPEITAHNSGSTGDVSIESAKVSLRTLAKFVRNPIVAEAEDKLRMRTSEYEEEVDVFEEPTGIQTLQRMSLVRNSVCEGLMAAPGNPENATRVATAHFHKLRDNARIRGDFPLGILGDHESKSIEESLEAICRALTECEKSEAAFTHAASYAFGEDTTGSAAHIHPPVAIKIELNGTSLLCRVVGNLALLQKSQHAFRIVVFSMRSEKSFKDDPLPEYTSGILQLAALRTLNPFEHFPNIGLVSVVLLRENTLTEKTIQIPPPAEFENILKTLTSDYLSHHHDMFLPSKPVTMRMKLAPPERWTGIEEPLWELWQREQDSENSNAGNKGISKAPPLPNAHTYLPPQNAKVLYERRFDSILNMFMQKESKK
jgi:exodeoxyribonuclease V gamma subunit